MDFKIYEVLKDLYDIFSASKSDGVRVNLIPLELFWCGNIPKDIEYDKGEPHIFGREANRSLTEHMV